MNHLAYLRSFRTFAAPLLLGAALALTGCEDEGPLDPDPVDGDEDQTFYIADLTELNDSGVTGRVGFTVDAGDSTLDAAVEAAGLTEDQHPQHVMVGGSCPTAADDANGDGFVDVVEGLAVFGPILISLDDNLEDNRFGEGEFPDDDTIDYEESVDMDELLQDLRRVDEDPNDDVGTLGANEELSLAGRAVVIHGIGDNAGLPGTVQSIGGLPAQTMMPVACGIIRLR